MALSLMLESLHKDNPRLWNDSTEEWTREGAIYMGKLNRLTGVRRSSSGYGPMGSR